MEERRPPGEAGPTDEGEIPNDANAEGTRRFVTDAVRKAFLAGVGAIFLTEEGARKLAREWKLPKEVLGFVTSQAAGAKDEVLRVVSDEVRKFFESESPRREFLKLVGSMSIEIHATVRLKDAGGGKPRLELKRASAKPRLERAGEEPDSEPEPGAR